MISTQPLTEIYKLLGTGGQDRTAQRATVVCFLSFESLSSFLIPVGVTSHTNRITTSLDNNNNLSFGERVSITV
jgi:hypothetical protein